MNKIADFLKSKFYAIVWTACYIILMWAILDGMFGFPMFSATAWNKLMHAHLRGFAGFTFGILILAALPLYVATTTIIARTGKPLFSIKIPERIRKLYAPTAEPTPEKEAAPPPPPAPDTYEMPKHLPTELHGAFLRARSHIGIKAPTTAFSIPQPVPALATANTNTASDTPDGTLPLPTDFDFDDTTTPSADSMPFDSTPIFNDIPTFSDITFDDDAPTPASAPDITNPSPTPSTTTDTQNPVVDFLATHNRTATMHGDLIICDDMIIATHDDKDFWIADDETWFANGKSRPSPIAELHAAADGLRPILYLASRNIFALDTKIAEWQSAGITVIESLDALL